MEKKIRNIKIGDLIKFGKYVALPYFVGWCIPTFSRYTENYNFKVGSALTKYLKIQKDQEFFYVYKNFQYMMSFKKLICILLIGIISYMIEKKYWKNSENIKNKYIKGLKVLSVFAFFYMGMKNSESWLLFLVVLLLLYFYFKIEINEKCKELKLIIKQKKLREYLEKLLAKQTVNKGSITQGKKLIQSREHKKELLMAALKNKAIKRILIDGEWGVGKTTFVDFTLEDMKDIFEPIKIDIMIFNNRKKIKEEFLNQLKPILKKEKINFSNANEYIDFIDSIGGIWSHFIKYAFYSNESFEEAKNKMKEDLKFMSKEIIIVFDNLERVLNSSILEDNEIKEVIGFIHEIAEIDKIKAIVIADYRKLTSNYKLEENKDETSKEINYHSEYFKKFYDYKVFIEDCSVNEILQMKYSENKDEIYEKYQTIFRAISESLESKYKKDIKDNYEKLKNKKDLDEKEKLEIYNSFIGKKELFEKEIRNTRVIEKIIQNYNNMFISEDNFVYEGIEDELKILSSIYGEIHYDDLKRENEDEVINSHYVEAFFRVKRTKGRKIYEILDKLSDNDKKNIKRVLFSSRSEIEESIRIIESIIEEKQLYSKLLLKSYLDNLKIYVELNGISDDAKKGYEKIIEKIKELYSDDNSGFLEVINHQIVWQMEEYLYKENKIGDICQYIVKKNIYNNYSIKGIDFFILVSFKDILIYIIKFINDKEDERIYEGTYYFDKPLEGQGRFPNYLAFIDQIYTVLDKVTPKGFGKTNELYQLVAKTIDDRKNLLGKMINTENMKRELKRFLDRMEIFINMYSKEYEELRKPEEMKKIEISNEEQQKINEIENLEKKELIKKFEEKFLNFLTPNLERIQEIYIEKSEENEEDMRMIDILISIKRRLEYRERRKKVMEFVDNDDFVNLQKHIEITRKITGDNKFIEEIPESFFKVEAFIKKNTENDDEARNIMLGIAEDVEG